MNALTALTATRRSKWAIAPTGFAKTCTGSAKTGRYYGLSLYVGLLGRSWGLLMVSTLPKLAPIPPKSAGVMA
eukprot:3905648-Pyramimonas_sp.AAC.1